MKRWHLAGRLPYKTAVNNWRRALGVSRTNNEGTNRLVRAAAAGGAAVIPCRSTPEKECNARSRRCKEPNLVPDVNASNWNRRRWPARQELTTSGIAKLEEGFRVPSWDTVQA